VAAQGSTRALTVVRLAAVDITVAWRWVPVTVLGTVLLGYSILPARFPTWDSSQTWLVSAAAVLACECGLLLHELSHALVARRSGQHVERIVFHGFVAETVLSAEPTHDVLAAVIGPATNLALAGFLGALRLGFGSQEPLGALLVLLVFGNLAMAAASLQPFGESDGARALRALCARAPAGEKAVRS
jgi:Zn-dependent protease